MAVLEKFTLFPKLPAEIRLKIFELNIPTDRWVDLDYEPSCRLYPGLWRERGIFKVHHDIPTNLHVCREWREDALKKYKRFSLSLEPRDTGKGSIQRLVYFDPSRDTLQIGRVHSQRIEYLMDEIRQDYPSELPVDEDEMDQDFVGGPSIPADIVKFLNGVEILAFHFMYGYPEETARILRHVATFDNVNSVLVQKVCMSKYVLCQIEKGTLTQKGLKLPEWTREWELDVIKLEQVRNQRTQEDWLEHE